MLLKTQLGYLNFERLFNCKLNAKRPDWLKVNVKGFLFNCFSGRNMRLASFPYDFAFWTHFWSMYKSYQLGRLAWSQNHIFIYQATITFQVKLFPNENIWWLFLSLPDCSQQDTEVKVGRKNKKKVMNLITRTRGEI